MASKIKRVNSGKDNCPWCAYKFLEVHKCLTGEQVRTCDFRSLKMEKQAILERSKKEAKIIMGARSKLRSVSSSQEMEQVLRDVLDRAEGLKVMIRVLMEKFGMDEKDIKEHIGYKEPSVMERASIAVQTKLMERMRRQRKVKT